MSEQRRQRISRADLQRISGAVALAIILSASLGDAPALAAPAATHRLDGECSLSGQITFERPIGTAPGQVDYSDSSAGTCTGTIDGVYRQNTPVLFRAAGSGMIGCAVARTASAGNLIFPALHARIGVTTEGLGALTEMVATFSGRVSGSGIVDVIFQGDASTTASCTAGTLTSVRYQLIGHTITPVVG
jgi:hypothetical protein